MKEKQATEASEPTHSLTSLKGGSEGGKGKSSHTNPLCRVRVSQASLGIVLTCGGPGGSVDHPFPPSLSPTGWFVRVDESVGQYVRRADWREEEHIDKTDTTRGGTTESPPSKPAPKSHSLTHSLTRFHPSTHNSSLSPCPVSASRAHQNVVRRPIVEIRRRVRGQTGNNGSINSGSQKL